MQFGFSEDISSVSFKKPLVDHIFDQLFFAVSGIRLSAEMEEGCHSDPVSANPVIFDSVVNAMTSPLHESHIILGHQRTATSGASNIPDPHPLIRKIGPSVYSLIHNGTLNKSILMDVLTNDGTDST